MMNRRSFMASILAAGAAPMIARAGVLMPVRSVIVPRKTQGGVRWVPLEEWQEPKVVLFGDGVTDDTAALQAILDGKPATWAGGLPFTGPLRTHLVTKTIDLRRNSSGLRSGYISFVNDGISPLEID